MSRTGIWVVLLCLVSMVCGISAVLGASIAASQHVPMGLIDRTTGFDWAAPGSAVGAYVKRGSWSMNGFEPHSGFIRVKQDVQKTTDAGKILLTEWKKADGLRLDWSLFRPRGLKLSVYSATLANTGTTPIGDFSAFGAMTIAIRGDLGPLKVYCFKKDSGGMQAMDLSEDFTLSSLATPDAAPWLAIESPTSHEIVYVGVQGDRPWTIQVRKSDGHWVLSSGLAKTPVELGPGESRSTPRVFVGFTHGSIDDSLVDLHQYLKKYCKKTMDQYP